MFKEADVVIVTALKVEREAVVRRLQGLVKVQEKNVPMTYYAGFIQAAGRKSRHRVVVSELLGMGNPEAAAAAARLFERWRPGCAFMTGIAGGVPGKVALGDVVVSESSYDYEPSKLVGRRTEHRGRHHTSDRLLFGRARDYEAAEWRGDIRVKRPTVTDVTFPRAYFGPIASGEKVIASEGGMKRLQKQCPKLIAVAMEGAGVARAAANHGQPIRWLEIRGVCDDATPTKDDRWHDYAAEVASAFTIGVLRTLHREEVKRSAAVKSTTRRKKTVVIALQSLRKITSQEIIPALRRSGISGKPTFLSMDFTDLVVEKTLINPEEAARRVCAPNGQLQKALRDRAGWDWTFQGLAAIPIAVLAGYLVTDRRHVRLFDYHPELKTWKWPGTPAGYPELQSSPLAPKPVTGTTDVTLRMAVSYPINHASINALGLGDLPRFDLSLPFPERSVVRSEDQVREYGRRFRIMLDLIARIVPGCKRLHLFYAGPMSLAFHLGQQISENIHPSVLVWNYARSHVWGVDLSAAVAGRSCIALPRTVARRLKTSEVSS